jgi:hypothetical protein
MICRHSSMPVLRGRLMAQPEAEESRGCNAFDAAILHLIALRSVSRAASASPLSRAASASPCRNLHFDANLQEPSACQFLQVCSIFIFLFLFLFFLRKSAAHYDSKQAVSNKLLAGRHVRLQEGVEKAALLLQAGGNEGGEGACSRRRRWLRGSPTLKKAK